MLEELKDGRESKTVLTSSVAQSHTHSVTLSKAAERLYNNWYIVELQTHQNKKL